MANKSFYGQSKNAEQYTPREWWERVIAVLGSIDCDPASDPNMSIPAKMHFTKFDDGLSANRVWGEKTYLNPVFGIGVIDWFRKLELEIRKGNVKETIVLWKAALETEATQLIIGIPLYQCSAVPNSRISFRSGDPKKKQGGGDSSTFTPIFHYFGKDPVKFIEIFSPYCTIWKPMRSGENPSLDCFGGVLND